MDYENLTAEQADELIKREPGTVVEETQDKTQFRIIEDGLYYRREGSNYVPHRNWHTCGSGSISRYYGCDNIRFRVVSRATSQPEKLTGAQALERSARTGEAFTNGAEYVWLRFNEAPYLSGDKGKTWEPWSVRGLHATLCCDDMFRMVEPSEWADAEKEKEPERLKLSEELDNLIKSISHQDTTEDFKFLLAYLLEEFKNHDVFPLIRSEIAKANKK